MTKKKKPKSHEQVVASTAGDSSWKAWANRSHGNEEFEVLDIFRGVKRSFQQRFVWGIPPHGTPCPVCFVVPDHKSDWHVTTGCGHAVCRDCLQGYSASLVRDPDHVGPLKCPCCTQHLRPKDAIQALQHDSTLIAQWDAKLRDQLLRALPGYRHCPHCNSSNKSNRRKRSTTTTTTSDSNNSSNNRLFLPEDTSTTTNETPPPSSESNSNSQSEKNQFMGGGGFVTPECLAPIHNQREHQALEWLDHPIQSQQTAIVLYFLYVYIYSEHHSTSIYVDILNTSLLPAWCVRRLWLLSRKLIAGRARKTLFQPLKVECPCCNRSFLLNAESELGNTVLADKATQEWIGSNTRPCPRCSVPISKIDGCNHMKCSSCRVQFCWACMRINSSKCAAFDCQNGAPYGNADALLQTQRQGNNNINNDDDTGILNRIARLENEATHVTIGDVGVWVSIGIGLLAGESPSVQLLAKGLVKSFALIFSVGFMTCMCLLGVLCVMFRDTFYRHQQDVNNHHHHHNQQQRQQQPVDAAGAGAGNIVQDRIQEFLEEQMMREAIQRSLGEQ